MNHSCYDQPEDLHDLVFKYEVMSQKGTVSKLEETVFLRILDFYENMPSLEKALHTVDQAIRQYKFSGGLHLRKARLLLLNNDPQAALESLDRAEIFGQHIKAVDLLRARAHAYLREFEDAMAILCDLRHFHYLNNEELSEVLFIEAWVHEKRENFERMFYCLKDALQENPNHEQALQRMWMAVEICKKYSESVFIHDRILDQNPYSYQAWFNLGHAHYSQNNYELAIQAFEFSFIINEKFEMAYRDYAEVCFEMKQYGKALKCYLEASEHFEDDAEGLLKIGECHEYTGEIAKARIYYFRALALDQRSDEVYFRIGESYRQEDNWTTAAHFYKQAIKIDNEREDYLAALALAYINLKIPKKALPLFQKATELAPEQTSYWVQYAGYYLKNGKFDKAMNILDEAELNTIGADLLYCKAACFFLMDNRTEGLDTLGEALQEDFEMKETFFEYVPHLRTDRKVKAIIRYYASE